MTLWNGSPGTYHLYLNDQRTVVHMIRRKEECHRVRIGGKLTHVLIWGEDMTVSVHNRGATRYSTGRADDLKSEFLRGSEIMTPQVYKSYLAQGGACCWNGQAGAELKKIPHQGNHHTVRIHKSYEQLRYSPVTRGKVLVSHRDFTVWCEEGRHKYEYLTETIIQAIEPYLDGVSIFIGTLDIANPQIAQGRRLDQYPPWDKKFWTGHAWVRLLPMKYLRIANSGLEEYTYVMVSERHYNYLCRYTIFGTAQNRPHSAHEGHNGSFAVLIFGTVEVVFIMVLLTI
jgi:hypothetical protein